MFIFNDHKRVYRFKIFHISKCIVIIKVLFRGSVKLIIENSIFQNKFLTNF